MGEQGAGRARLHRAVRRCRRGGYVPRPIRTSRIERTPTRGPLPCIAAGSSRASIASPLYPHGHPPRTFADPHTRTPDPPADSTEPLFHSGYPTTTSVTGSQFDLDVKVRARTAPDPTPAPLQKSKFTNGPARESLFSRLSNASPHELTPTNPHSSTREGRCTTTWSGARQPRHPPRRRLNPSTTPTSSTGSPTTCTRTER